MVESLSFASLKKALAPVEALRGEQSLLEAWVCESFAALETLHGELSDWQRDLTRQQAMLDQREAAVADATRNAEAVAEMERQLARARGEARELEEENAEQLKAVEQLERQLTIAKAELRVVNKQSEELRRLMERQSAMLDRLMGGAVSEASGPSADASAVVDGVVETEDAGDDVATTTAAELRRRAESRRAAQRRPD